MLLKHFFIGKIAHSSYLLAGQNYCAVIDPQRDVDVYITEARTMGVQITTFFKPIFMLISFRDTWTWRKKPVQKFT
jgi:hypothetical protein